MTFTIEESFEYHHKKFDQRKRTRTDSCSSNSDNYECIQVEIERLYERPGSPQSSGTNSASESSYNEQHTTPTPPPCKRLRTSSNSDSSYTTAYSPISFAKLPTTSTPYNSTPAILPPTAAILPKISNETLRSICKYHGNMVRSYPKKDRTPKDQERRNKNTIACRMSRRVKKLEQVAIEEQYKEFSQQNFKFIEHAMRSALYLKELIRLSKEDISIEENKLNMEVMKEEKSTTLGQGKKPFTIDFLLGNHD